MNPPTLPSIFTLGYYWEAKIFLVSVRLDVYSALSDAPRTATDVANRIGADAGVLKRLLDALVTLGLLTCDGGKYANTSQAAEFLVKTSPFYMGELMWLQDEEWNHWGRLEEIVRTGRPPVRGNLFMDRADLAERTLKVLTRMARRTAPDLAAKIDLSGYRTFLDVGGGAGAFSMAFCRRYPNLTATLFDLPETLVITKKAVEAEKMQNRVHLVSGNFNQDEMPGTFDVIFLSDILHYQTHDENAMLIAKIHRAIHPGGRIIVKDMFINDDPAHPGWNAIFSIHMLVYSEKGRCFRLSEAREWLARNAFENIAEVERNTVLTAIRP